MSEPAARYLLPIRLTVARVRATPTGVEVDGVVEDSRGENVRSFSLTMPPGTSAAGASASIAEHAAQVARGLHAARLADHGPVAGAVEHELEVAGLVGRVFEGSVAQ